MKEVESLSVKVYNAFKNEIETKEVEELIKELVALTVPLTFHIECLKSQAIIMRTNILRQLKIYGGAGVFGNSHADISTDQYPGVLHIEEYKKIWGQQYENNIEILNKAINDTEGQVIFLEDKLIDARYHYVCGGSTENSENVDGNIVQYLRKVLCNYCKDSSYNFDYIDMAIEDIENKLGIKFLKASPIKNMSIENVFDNIVRDEEGRIVKLNIGGKEFKGIDVMERLGLNSTRFSWRPEKIRFYTKGKGNGIGLCVFGANEMAMQGKLAEEILKYYYTGVNVKRIEKISINCPLKGKAIVIDPGHGGEECKDYRSIYGDREKDINLDVSLMLKEKLEDLGAKVYLTRAEDVNKPLSQRANMANDILPHFFLTIHQNYYNEPSISGTEIYYYRGDKEAFLLGEKIMEQINIKVGLTNRGVKAADFYLLRDVKVSSLHLELGYLSNEKDLVLLKSKHCKEKIAEAIAEGIVAYYF